MSSLDQVNIEDNSNLFSVNKGMWIFIFFDLILFAGLLIYHYLGGIDFPTEYSFAKSELLLSFGTVNTIILLTSGLTMGLSKVAAIEKNKFLSMVFVTVTFTFGLLFVINRIIDCAYLGEFGYLYGTDAFSNLSNGLAIFFSTYFFSYFIFMAHLLVGLVLLLMLLMSLVKNEDVKDSFVKLNTTLVYWSYLTLIWLFIFPVLFLI